MILLVPTLGLDLSLLHRLDKSIDYPVDKVLVNNSGHSIDLPGWRILNQDRNLGVAGSWNMAQKFTDRAWIIMNDDAWFTPGALEALCKEAQRNDYHFLFSSCDWCCFVWTRKAIELCGTFDENFWPGYFEDTDMFVRMGNTGAIDISMPESAPNVLHGRGSYGPVYEAQRNEWCRKNEQYFMRKWGRMSLKLHKPYSTPFNKYCGSNKEWTLEKT